METHESIAHPTAQNDLALVYRLWVPTLVTCELIETFSSFNSSRRFVRIRNLFFAIFLIAIRFKPTDHDVDLVFLRF